VKTDSAHGRGSGPPSPLEHGVFESIISMIFFIFGGTFVGLALLLVSTQFHGKPIDILLTIIGEFCIIWAFNGRSVSFLFVAIVVTAVFLGAEFAIRALATLATNGIYGPDRSGWGLFYAENYVLFGILWLLIGVPYRAFKYKVDSNGKGSAQGAITGGLAVTGSLLIGAFILLLHAGNGPFSAVDIKALSVGAVFTVCLTIPIFRAVTKAFWERGIFGCLSLRPLAERWRKALAEVHVATSEYWLDRTRQSFIERYGFDPESGPKRTGDRDSKNSINQKSKAAVVSAPDMNSEKNGHSNDTDAAQRVTSGHDLRTTHPSGSKDSRQRGKRTRKR
jgi:hypothetical protein